MRHTYQRVAIHQMLSVCLGRHTAGLWVHVEDRYEAIFTRSRQGRFPSTHVSTRLRMQSWCMTLGSRLIQLFLFNLPCSCLSGINKMLTFKSMALDWSCDWLDPRPRTSLLSRTCSSQSAVPPEARICWCFPPRSLPQFLYGKTNKDEFGEL